MPPHAMPPTSLTARIHELVSACFTGIGLETCESRRGREHEDLWLYGGFLPRGTRELERALGMSGRESLLPEFFNQNSTGEQLRQGY